MDTVAGPAERVVYVGGDYVPESEAKISVFDHVALCGDAVYDTVCAWNSRVIKLDEHSQRSHVATSTVRPMSVQPAAIQHLASCSTVPS